MAVFEIVLPKLKKDAALIAEVEANILPAFRVKLQEAGVLNGLRGFLVTEDGRDVRQDFREILLLGIVFIILLLVSLPLYGH